jgi:hypothetical protein
MLKIITKHKKPEILVMTPLLTGHKISGETRTTIKRNTTPYTWASFESNRKHAANCQAGIEEFQKQYKFLPKYIFILDRDIILGRGLIDKLYNLLKITEPNVGYAYCPFEYKGYVNHKVPPKIWSSTELKKNNFISSNSLIKTEMWKKIGGYVTEEKYHRLSDWSFWLKAYNNGYKGILCENTSFIAMSTENDISAGDKNEHRITKELIIKDFIGE